MVIFAETNSLWIQAIYTTARGRICNLLTNSGSENIQSEHTTCAHQNRARNTFAKYKHIYSIVVCSFNTPTTMMMTRREPKETRDSTHSRFTRFHVGCVRNARSKYSHRKRRDEYGKRRARAMFTAEEKLVNWLDAVDRETYLRTILVCSLAGCGRWLAPQRIYGKWGSRR